MDVGVEEVETDVELSEEVVEVTVTVEVMWTVVSETLPALAPLPAPPGANRTGTLPSEEAELPLKA